MQDRQKTQSGFPSDFLNQVKSFFTSGQLRCEKARLEAFLSALPGDYCGFGKDGTIAYSQGFLDAFGLSSVSDIEDILGAADSTHGAALEAHLNILKQSGKHFQMECHIPRSGKILQITGTIGQAINESDQFLILWVLDKSQHKEKVMSLEKRAESAEYDVYRLRSALDAMPVLSWIRDKDGEIIWCNKPFAQARGVEKSEIIARQLELPLTTAKKGEKQLHPVRKMALTALEQNESRIEKYHCIIKGQRLLLSVQEAPLTKGSGTLGLAQDISREEELESEQARYMSANKELLQQLQSAIGIFAADTRLEFYNNAFASLWNLEASWLNTKPHLPEILDKLRETRQLPEQADFLSYKQEWLDMFTSLMAPHDQMMYQPNGNILRNLIIPHPMGGLMMIFEDVTSRLELESSYNTLIAVQKETLDNLSESVIVFGGDGRVKLWNPSYRKLWGLHNEDLDNEPHISKLVEKHKNFFTDEGWPKVREDMMSLALNRAEQVGRFEREDGLLLEYATVPLPDGGMLVTFFDVTDKIRVERALREKNKALEEAEQLKSDFLANVSYQLRTPLNSIMGFNDILSYEYFGSLNEKQKEYTASIQEASEKLRDLIDNILDLASFEARQLSLNIEEFKLRPMMEQIHEIVEVWARKEGLELKLECPKNIGSMTADPRRIKQALMNILRNSIAFTPKGGKIKMKVAKRKNNVIFTISDTGIGISDKDIKRIFSPFERVEVSAEQRQEIAHHGVGLGLSLVKNIFDMHHGRVEVESKPDKGTKMIVTMPASPEKRRETLISSEIEEK